MPNTLAHIGAQTLPWKLVRGQADIKWLGLGCIIPDVPWILQRVATALVPGIDLLGLRIYCMIQASLFFCLLLSAAIAAMSRRAVIVLLICGSGSLLHLLLDAAQTKWANGVHFLVPLSWKLTQFELFWPEHSLTLVLTFAGFASLLFFGWRDRYQLVELRLSAPRLVLATSLLATYILLPLALLGGPLQADNHYVATLADFQGRTGQAVGFDRCHYDKKDNTIRIFTKERLEVTGLIPDASGTVSLTGYFADNRTVVIQTLHIHKRFRDIYSIGGLSILLLLWVMAAAGGRIRIDRK